MPDFINGLFETIGGFLLFLSILKIVKEKKVRGVSIYPTIFWSLWGFWNLYYYPTLGQMFSFFGGILVVIMNTTWVCLAIHYSMKEKGITYRAIYERAIFKIFTIAEFLSIPAYSVFK